MKRFLLRCLFYLQPHRLMHYLHRKKIIILRYHGFTDKKIHEGSENYRGNHLNVEKFRSQVEYLKKYYNVISLGQLIAHYATGARIPDNSIVITIDDGYKSGYVFAYPILKEFNVPATIFLITDFIDKKEPIWVDRIEYAINMTKSKGLKLKIGNDMLSFDFHDNDSKIACDRKIRSKLKSIPQELRQEIIESLEHGLGQKISKDNNVPEIYHPLEWHELLEMVKSGVITIGSHTCSHVILTRCSLENIKKELLLSKQLIERKTKLSCGSLCYPNGKSGDFDCHTKNLLRELGYSCGLTTVSGMNDEHSDVFELKRLNINNRQDLIGFITTLSWYS